MNQRQDLSDYQNWLMKSNSEELYNYAIRLGVLFIKSHEVRAGFYNEINQFIKHVQDKKSDIGLVNANRLIQEEYNALKTEERQLLSKEVFPFAVAQQTINQNGVMTYVIKGIGLVAGVGQIVVAAGMSWSGVAIIPGSFLVLHGTTNIYENGYFLLTGEEAVGPGRWVYRKISNVMGEDNNMGDIVYAGVDLGLSAYGLLRPVLNPNLKIKPLFRYINDDLVASWQTTNKSALMMGAIGDITTIKQLHNGYALKDK